MSTLKNHSLFSKRNTFRVVFAAVASFFLAWGASAVLADSTSTDFEAFSLGSVNGQNGWSMTGPYDAEIVDASAVVPAFGSRSLRISNAVTSGSFVDQTFSQPLAEEAGETDAENGGASTGPRQEYFEAEWDFASAVPGSEQPGLSIVVSPDRGDGARMGWIQMADTPAGLEVNFYGYDTSLGGTCGDLTNFVFTTAATGLDRTIPHTIKVTMEFNDGINDDVVELYVDGNLVHTGKSWEDYFRNCEPPGSRTVDSLLFRSSGTAAPATSGQGFFIDNLSLFSGPVPVLQCTTDCYVDANTGSDANGGTSPADAKQTIQAGINQVDPNGTVHVAAGTYPESLDINKALTLSGAGTADVTIDASGSADYSLDVTSSDVTLEGFTLLGNLAGTYGIKVAGPSPTRIGNITIQNVVVDSSKRTGVDLNGVDGALIKDVEVKNVPSGNGLAITDSNDIVFENITTSNNAWGGLAIYTYGRYFSLGSDNVTIQGTNSFGEDNKVYVERGNYNDPGNPEPITNLTVNGFAYTVMNDTFRPGGENFTFYQITQSDAIAFAIGLATPADSYVNEIATGDFWVGTIGGVDMTIQAAIDHASAGDTINVLPGTYEANVTVDEFVKIIGAGSGSDENTNTILKKSANAAVVTVAASGTSNADPLLFKDLRVEPVSVYGFNVAGGAPEYVKFDNVHVVGSSTSAATEAEVGLKVATTASLSNVVITDSAFDQLDYGWYFAKHGDWGPGGSNVTDIMVSNTSFSSNQAKGIYVEKLSETTFDNVTVNNNGLDTAFYNAKWNAGFDINLKGEETYQNITIKNSTFDSNGLGVDEGAALMIKGRDDGGTYGAHPAALDGVIIMNNEITNNERGLRFGEPGKNNATPTNTAVGNNNIVGNLLGGVINETQSHTPAELNWWGDVSGPSGEGPGTGDSVTVNVSFCPWLDAPAPGGSPTTPSGGFATTSTDGHTTKYCTIEEAMFASSGANQEVHVEEGNWPGEVMNRDYTDSPDLVVKAIGDRDNTIIDGITLTGAGFDGLTFTNFTITGDAPTPSGYDPGYAVEITNNGNYKNLAFVSNIFDGENIQDAAAIFSNRGWDGFLLDDNKFVNFNESPLTPLDDTYYANYSLVFMEAQVYTPEGRGDNYVATDNVFEGITHLNALEAFRWQNVTMTGNKVTGTFGRLLVWSYNTDPLVGVEISGNEIEITAGNDTATSTGIGIYYADADVNITDNTIIGANTCINTTGVTDLELTGNTLTNCATRGHYFSDSDLDGNGPDAPYVAPVSALIEGNTFDTGPVGVENVAQTFELNACNNTFIDIGDKRFENPGPFAPCGEITITKFNDKNMDGVQDENEDGLKDWTFEVILDQDVTEYTTDADGMIVVSNLEAGEYEVCEIQKDGWKNTTDLCQEVTLEDDGSASLSFGNFRPKLSPVLECVYTPQDSLTSYALFGYNTKDIDPVSQPIGGDNKFTPAPQDQGQPTEFATGRQVGVFWVPFTSNNLVWTLKHPDSGQGGTATAGLGLNTCGDRAPTGTITIAKEATNVPEAPSLNFAFNGDLGEFAIAAGESETFEVAIGSYDVSENVPANWGLTDVTCEGGNTSDIANGANINLGMDDEVVCTFTNTPTCDDPDADLTGTIEWNSGKGWVTNHSSAFCSWDVGMASYKKYNEVIDDQILFDYVDGVTVEPGETVMLEIDIPECAVQVDLFRGEVLLSLDGQRYGDRLITAARHYVGTGYCGDHPGDVNTLSGFVTINGESLEGVTVEIEQLGNAASAAKVGETTTTTNIDGFYSFPGLELGRYQVTISGDKLNEAEFANLTQIVVLDGETVTVTNFAGDRTVPTAVTLSAVGSNPVGQSTFLMMVMGLLFTLTAITLWRRDLLPVRQDDRL